MANRPPRSDQKNLIPAGNSRAQLPRTELALDLGTTGHDFVHVRALPRIFLDHVSDKWLYELEPFAFLGTGLGRRIY
jgi:hypothetical protein